MKISGINIRSLIRDGAGNIPITEHRDEGPVNVVLNLLGWQDDSTMAVQFSDRPGAVSLMTPARIERYLNHPKVTVREGV